MSSMPLIFQKCIAEVATPRGFEPPTYRLGICRSILLSYGVHCRGISCDLFIADQGWSLFKRCASRLLPEESEMCVQIACFGWGGRIRTSVCRNQNPVPYRLATPQLGGGPYWLIPEDSNAAGSLGASYLPGPRLFSGADHDNLAAVAVI
jgi:hypothetical protein